MKEDVDIYSIAGTKFFATSAYTVVVEKATKKKQQISMVGIKKVIATWVCNAS